VDYAFCTTFRRPKVVTIYAKSAREKIAAATLNTLREIAEHAEID
jgi:hypothetical protein